MKEPRWLTIARGYIGTREIVGPKHSGVIQGWLSKLKAWWRDDETPWCGVFVAECLRESGLSLPDNWFRAKAWAEYGSRLQMHRLAPGAILVFAREGGGHVGFYVGETQTHFQVLGGNQGNAVSLSLIAKARCIAARWPKGEPVIGGPVWPKVAGGAVSTNEA
jgi:uncharacterized protein (TIGR02594 family)